MSYHIRYDQADKPVRRGRRISLRFIAAFILAAVVVAIICFPTQVRELRRHALPFLEPTVTQAFGQMLSDIRFGITPQDAAIAFGRKIIFEEASY